eukprot:scaffold83052_cov37-Tisochrysis_lutea.AAC.4
MIVPSAVMSLGYMARIGRARRAVRRSIPIVGLTGPYDNRRARSAAPAPPFDGMTKAGNESTPAYLVRRELHDVRVTERE